MRAVVVKLSGGDVFEIDLHRDRRADAPPKSGVGAGGRMRWRYHLTRFRLGSKLAASNMSQRMALTQLLYVSRADAAST